LSKTRSIFICQNCGVESPKWQGRCPSCGEWNTFAEELVRKENGAHSKSRAGAAKGTGTKPELLKDIERQHLTRISTRDPEFDRVLGGGIVPGSVILIGGDPGIGKSTLMLQITLGLSDKKVLYVSGEESGSQIRMRAERMGRIPDNCYILSETDTADIFYGIDNLQPEMVIVDSIQTLTSPDFDAPAGSVTQIRQSAHELMKFAKENNVPVFLIGHITKDGSLAGPKVLEHMVDTVLQFEGDRQHVYRILRSVKNRFGSTSELGIYEMQGQGLRTVENPSELLLTQREQMVSGIAVGSTMEGIRPLLIEVQALVSPAAFGNPQRSATGYNFKRLHMLAAVLEKRSGFMLGNQDIFLNLTGGIKVEDPALDLPVCMAIISSYQEIAIPGDLCFSAEIGLSGELRAVNRIENRILEAERQGFRKIIVSSYNAKNLKKIVSGIEIKTFSRIDEVIRHIIGKY
jgi:DNA repair protein RadA/Sms